MPERIGDIAKAAGVGVETVRFYEREGLVDRPAKPLRGWRDYDGVARAQLEQVLLGRRFGLGLADIKQIRQLATGPQPPFCATVRDIATQRLAALRADMKALEEKCAALERWLEGCAGHAEGACPLYQDIHRILPPTGRKNP